MTLYRHFSSKEELVLAFLERREAVWTNGVAAGRGRAARTEDPAAQLLAIFDAFDEWFRQPDFEGCSFINVMLEAADPQDTIHCAGARYLATIRTFLERGWRATRASRTRRGFARKWHILMKGSIVAAGEGDRDAARRGQEMGALLLERELGTARAA